MDSNTHSTGPSEGLAALAATLEGLAAQDLTGLTDAARAERVLRLRRLLDRLEGHWLAELATLDACGAAGAEQGVQAGSTASWLRTRLRMGAGAASSAVRTARALFRGPLTQTGQALTDGKLTPAHASVLAAGTHQLPNQVTVEAEPVLVEAARRWIPAGSGGSSATSSWSPTPRAPPAVPNDATSGEDCGWPPPWRAWWPSMGCWRPRPARPCWPPWSPWPARPTPRMPAVVVNAGLTP